MTGLKSLFLLTLLVLRVPSQMCRAGERMNVLFLCVDDLNTWLLSDPNRYTGRVAAPAIQKLARDGVLFTRAYCASPKCSPSRTAVLSGVAPWKSGIYQNAQLVNESPALKAAISLPQHFRNNGYYTASAGKISHGYDIRRFWHEHIPHKRDPVPPNAPLSTIGRGEKDWGPIHLPESQMNDTRYADFAIAQLKKKHDKPFLIACGLFHPHYPWYVPQKYLDMYPLDEIVLPEVKEDDLADVPEEGVELANPSTHEKIVKANEYKRAVQGYLASTSYADAQIGRVLATLESSPYKDNTLVVLWSDHGFHLGEKLHWAKGTLWEEATHSLLMMRVPGVTKPRQVCHRFVSLLDIYPTLVELCGLPALPQFDGNSLVPLLKTPSLPCDRPAITGYLGMRKLDVHLTVRTEDYRYIRYGGGGREFYHCRRDPHEWTNQVGNPEFRAELTRHIAMLPEPAEPIPYVERRRKATKRRKD
jgi:arylsulfatase A-like enzyme